MDSQKHLNDPLLKIWRVVAGGSQSVGMTKLVVFLAAYILIGGLFFAFVTR